MVEPIILGSVLISCHENSSTFIRHLLELHMCHLSMSERFVSGLGGPSYCDLHQGQFDIGANSAAIMHVVATIPDLRGDYRPQLRGSGSEIPVVLPGHN